jgi:diacylglycerol kinase
VINLFKVFRSFKYAWAGARLLFKHENNAKVHLLAALVVILTGFWLNISGIEWGVVCLAIGCVWAAEAFNTALEKLCDWLQPEQHPVVKIIKDLSAAAVFFVAMAAAMAGLIIFLPKIWVIFVSQNAF